jgi:hypothetical protein
MNASGANHRDGFLKRRGARFDEFLKLSTRCATDVASRARVDFPDAIDNQP